MNFFKKTPPKIIEEKKNNFSVKIGKKDNNPSAIFSYSRKTDNSSKVGLTVETNGKSCTFGAFADKKLDFIDFNFSVYQEDVLNLKVAAHSHGSSSDMTPEVPFLPSIFDSCDFKLRPGKNALFACTKDELSICLMKIEHDLSTQMCVSGSHIEGAFIAKQDFKNLQLTTSIHASTSNRSPSNRTEYIRLPSKDFNVTPVDAYLELFFNKHKISLSTQTQIEKTDIFSCINISKQVSIFKFGVEVASDSRVYFVIKN